MSKYTITEESELQLEICVSQYLPKVSWSIKDTQHSNWLFFWNPTGRVKLFFDGKEIFLGQESAVLLPPYTRISAYSEEQFSHIYSHFTVSAPFDRVANRVYFLPPESAEKFYLEQRFLPPEWRSRAYWKILLYEYLLKLPPEAFEQKNQIVMDERIARAMEYCREHFLDPFGNDFLAEKVGMSVNHFYRLFQRDLGISPKRYRENLRLEFARKMLLETEAAIPHIAIHCGYADRYQFSKAFKKCFGLTPAAIRLR